MRIAVLFCACFQVFPPLQASTDKLLAQEEAPFRGLSILQQIPTGAQKTGVQFHEKAPALKRRITRRRNKWFLVQGFAGSVYVYGQVQIRGKRDVSGYLYRDSGQAILIYGELVNQYEIYARDALGITYYLILQQKNDPASYP